MRLPWVPDRPFTPSGMTGDLSAWLVAQSYFCSVPRYSVRYQKSAGFVYIQ